MKRKPRTTKTKEAHESVEALGLVSFDTFRLVSVHPHCNCVALSGPQGTEYSRDSPACPTC